MKTLNWLQILIITTTISISGCSDSSQEKTARSRIQNEDDKKFEEFRESETLIAFGNIQFGDSERTVKEKLETIPNIIKRNIGNRTGYKFGEYVQIELEYNNGALYNVSFKGTIEHLKTIRQVLIEKYKLSAKTGFSGDDEPTIDGTKYKIKSSFHHVGSRKKISFVNVYWYYDHDRIKTGGSEPEYSNVSISDSKIDNQIKSKEESDQQEKLNNDRINTRKTF